MGVSPMLICHKDMKTLKKKNVSEIPKVNLDREKERKERGGDEDEDVCSPMLICPERGMEGKRKRGRGCRDVFECA